MFRSLLFVSLSAVTLALAPVRAVQAQEEVTVFAAASLKTALDEIAAQGGTPVRLVYGGSSALARQIQQGAPAQLFISANTDWMDVLEADGLIVAESRIDLLTNRLVLVAPADSDVAVTLAPGVDLTAALGPEGRIAMALTESVPAGIYGKAALSALGIWDSLAERTAQADNVRAALNLVALGETPLGIVYATDAVAEPRVKVVATFDASLHAPIVYPAAIVTEGDSPAVRAFFETLQGEAAHEIFAAQGFGFAGGGD
ncbi:molybdate ABC transporter substrate-binding protein [Seohaeicola zhoushanensis]|uniref:Molybdate ABC transporter substrate-binding protein n=1 Tax=Seohaeicola zhoushanensis TaxID=1569283 RepID=A0A8J3M6W2_9RHOB|nr:molybdate ABC transporter substrate-binding protein [Seohaeicola zhoushanensis]GHF49316.1 molybdate ABC transporter substrate-binding protein [Seohaeicola zhoushanensis]